MREGRKPSVPARAECFRPSLAKSPGFTIIHRARGRETPWLLVKTLLLRSGSSMTISATTVKTLRDRTNAPMMDCKAALIEGGGDLDKAVEILRKKNASIQTKRGDRETAEGRIEVFIDPVQKVGAILEMRCESAPVTKSEQFIGLAKDVARQVALKNPASVEALLAQPYLDTPGKTVNERIGDVVGIIRENMKPARFVRLSGLLGSYIHHDGTVGVLVQVEGPGADPQLL